MYTTTGTGTGTSRNSTRAFTGTGKSRNSTRAFTVTGTFTGTGMGGTRITITTSLRLAALIFIG